VVGRNKVHSWFRLLGYWPPARADAVGSRRQNSGAAIWFPIRRSFQCSFQYCGESQPRLVILRLTSVENASRRPSMALSEAICWRRRLGSQIAARRAMVSRL
jgi:hypothetical protein